MEIKLTPNPEKPQEWIVLEDFTVHVCGRYITVKKGFSTDIASVPWFARWLFPRYGKHTRAAIVHDWCYEKRSLSQPKADKTFLVLMLSDGVFFWRACVMYLIVKYLGTRTYATDVDD